MELSLSSWTTPRGEFRTGIIRDVTERNRQSRKLEQMEEQLRLTFDNAPIGMTIVSVAGTSCG